MNCNIIAGILFTCIGLALLVWYIKEKIRSYSVKALMLKSLVSCCFMGAAFSGVISGGNDSFPVWILAGLFCGLMGDVWLDLKLVYPKDDTSYTFAGFAFFAVGHICFMAGLIRNFGMPLQMKLLIPSMLLSVLIGVSVVLLGPVLHLDYGKFRGISMFYASLLVGTAVISLAMILQTGGNEPIPIIMLIGGILFLLSDLILSGTYFGKGKERPIDLILNYIFYYGAQFTIAWAGLLASAAFLKM